MPETPGLWAELHSSVETILYNSGLRPAQSALCMPVFSELQPMISIEAVMRHQPASWSPWSMILAQHLLLHVSTSSENVFKQVSCGQNLGVSYFFIVVVHPILLFRLFTVSMKLIYISWKSSMCCMCVTRHKYYFLAFSGWSKMVLKWLWDHVAVWNTPG